MGSFTAKTLTPSMPNPTEWESTSPRTLWIRTVAGPVIGYGHLRRSLVLAKVLSGPACRVVFLLDPGDTSIRQHVAAAGFAFCSSEALPAEDPAAVVIDVRALDCSGLLTEARRRKVPVASIHDLGLDPLDSDVFIDGSILPKTNGQVHAAEYLGHEYLVLDPEFARFHDGAKTIRDSIVQVTIALGGGDSKRLFPKVLQGLRHWGKELEVVGFPGFTPWGQERLTRVDWGPVRFRWAAADEPVAALLFAADVAITAGGLSAYEALCVGTPLTALAWDQWQAETIAGLCARGACLDLGSGDSLGPAKVAHVLGSLQQNRACREQMSARGRAVVDGRGAERVAAIVRGLIGCTWGASVETQ